jgi:circadian clock protein KaiB
MATKRRAGSEPRKLQAEAPAAARYVLRLYVTGTTPKSARAITNLRQICEDRLKGRYELEVIDIYQHPSLLEGEQVVAAPTLVRKLPAPLRRLVGDMSNADKVLLGLDIRPKRTGR